MLYIFKIVKWACVVATICFINVFAFVPKKSKQPDKAISQQNKLNTPGEERYDNIFCDLFAFEPATFPNGTDAWLKYLADSTRYPEDMPDEYNAIGGKLE